MMLNILLCACLPSLSPFWWNVCWCPLCIFYLDSMVFYCEFWEFLCIWTVLWRPTGEGNGNPLQYSCLENPMDGGAWCAVVHGVTKSRTLTERLHFHFSLSCIGEGNGNPLQCSCLENPRDCGAWWAAICGVAQSWTQLKQQQADNKCLWYKVICK